MDTKKTTESLIEEQDTEYCYMCGGIQPIIIPRMEESEEEKE